MQTPPLYAQVAVAAGGPQTEPFTYLIPAEMQLRRGMSVVVPWRQSYALGIVTAVESSTAVASPRPIERVLDAAPLLDAAQLEAALAIQERYLSPLFAALSLFLPPGAPSRPKRRAGAFRAVIPSPPQIPPRLRVDPGADLEAAMLEWPQSKPSRPAALLERLAGGACAIDQAAKLLGGKRQLERWLATTSLARSAADQVTLAVSADDARAVAASLRRTAAERRRLALLRALADAPGRELDEREARRLSEAVRADVEALIELDLVERVVPSPQEAALSRGVDPTALTADQQSAADAVIHAIDAGLADRRAQRESSDEARTSLLHGVTGSGKTEIYLAAAAHALVHGGGVIVLVPEIALAPQTVARFEARFPGQVAVQHSQMPRSEAREQWRRVREGERRILVGPRSALFAPMPDLALIVIDEEHEWTYKQSEGQPRYQARDAARIIARRLHAALLLGSATPDLTSMAEARDGGDTLLSLPDRIQSDADQATVIDLPQVDVVDLRAELEAGVRSVFSRALDAALARTLAAGEQALLFLNRRGVAAHVCRACGEALTCPDCAIPMTEHRPGPLLHCHECGRREPIPERCPVCGDARVRPMSFGLEQLESELKRRFGEIAVLRWDRDSTRRHGDHQRILDDFAAGRAQVLIGTQMIAKGLDFPRVTLAAAINADLSLRVPDYTAAERTYQLLSQVAGRAGRGSRGGRVIIQTYSPDHYAVAAAAAHDYDAFYAAEIELRADHDHPPFARLAQLICTRTSAAEADRATAEMAALLRRERTRLGVDAPEVVGPAPAWPARRRGQERRQIVLRGPDPSQLLRRVTLGRGWTVDIDPARLL